MRTLKDACYPGTLVLRLQRLTESKASLKLKGIEAEIVLKLLILVLES